MAQTVNRLNPRMITGLTKPGLHADGAGLYLSVRSGGSKQWVFVYRFDGKRCELGLGGVLSITLASARLLADEHRKSVKAGIDPKAKREAAKEEARQAAIAPCTFADSVDGLMASKASEWRNDKHRGQWEMTLREYAKPMRSIPVAEVTTEDVLGVLNPLWKKTPETASRLRGRIEAVLDYARARGDIPRNEANPARWRGHLDKLLPKRQKLTRGHHAAMSYKEVPALIGRIREREATAALALEFTILAAARTGEVIGARWDEIDEMRKTWTVPPERMKAGREHRVPLSKQALAIVEKAKAARTSDYIFAGNGSDRPLSNLAMTMLLRRMKVEDVTVHGFRSSFRDWAGEETTFPREVVEAALAHVIGDKAEQAYRRGDALEKRRKLMQAWAAFCDNAHPKR